MAVSYLKKSKMYVVAQSLGFSDMSKMKDCTYKFYRGAEWLMFYCSDGYVQLGSQFSGKWFHVVVRNDDYEVVRDEVLTADDLSVLAS